MDLPDPSDIAPAVVEAASAGRSNMFPSLLRKKAKVVWSAALRQAWDKAVDGDVAALSEMVRYGAARDKLRQTTFRTCDEKLATLAADLKPHTPEEKLLAILSKANADNPGMGDIIHFQCLISSWHGQISTASTANLNRAIEALRPLHEAASTAAVLLNQLCSSDKNRYETFRSSGSVQALAGLVQDHNPRQEFEKIIAAREQNLQKWASRDASPVNSILNLVMSKPFSSPNQASLFPAESAIPIVLDDLVWPTIPPEEQADFLAWLASKKITSSATEMVRLHGKLTSAVTPTASKQARPRQKM